MQGSEQHLPQRLSNMNNLRWNRNLLFSVCGWIASNTTVDSLDKTGVLMKGQNILADSDLANCLAILFVTHTQKFERARTSQWDAYCIVSWFVVICSFVLQREQISRIGFSLQKTMKKWILPPPEIVHICNSSFWTDHNQVFARVWTLFPKISLSDCLRLKLFGE